MDFTAYKAFSDFVAPLFILIAGWLFKMIWDNLKDLQLDLKDLDEKIQTNYAKKDEFREAILDLKAMFNRIMDKLDNKVDK